MRSLPSKEPEPAFSRFIEGTLPDPDAARWSCHCPRGSTTWSGGLKSLSFEQPWTPRQTRTAMIVRVFRMRAAIGPHHPTRNPCHLHY